MSNVRVLPKNLRNGFAGVHIVGSLREDLERWSENWSRQDNAERDVEQDLDISVTKAPMMLCTSDAKDIYVNSRYYEIKLLKDRMADDLKEVDHRIKTEGIDAFKKVEEEGKIYYLTTTDTGSVWIYNYKTEEEVTEDEEGVRDIKYVNYYQVGKYSGTCAVAGIVDYIFKGANVALSTIISGLVAKIAQTILMEGVKLLLSFLVSQLVGFAAKFAIRVTITIVGAMSGFIGAVVFVLVFVGMEMIWDWATRKYTVQLCIYNWSTNNALHISDCYLDNGKMVCNEQDESDRCEITIPPMEAPNSVIMPPGFQELENLDSVCYYVTYFFENDSKFLEGLGIAMKVELGQKYSGIGFYYAFKCPRFGDNKQKVGADLENYGSSQDYYKNGDWNGNPLKFFYDVKGVTVCVTLDALMGNDSYYRPIVNYNVNWYNA